MARYIDAEDLKAVIKANDWSNPVVPDVVGIIIDRTPTADVVPKSEVDLYKRLNEELEDELASTYDKLEKAKTEVAKVILSDLKKQIHDKAIYPGAKDTYSFVNVKVFDAVLNNVLKKYTEGENE